jgi:acylphosphatase
LNSRVHVFVSGRVQGVFFRQRTKDKAESLGVTGWVRNLDDGRVEAVFEGEKDAVQKLVEFSRNGISRAVVTQVDLAWEPFSGEFQGFKIKY